MRADQLAKLQFLEEKLVDVVLKEADPDLWTGATTELKDLTKDERGDRYWCKKNAAATLSVLTKTMSVHGMVTRKLSEVGAGRASDTDDDSDLDREVNRAEREAEKILQRFSQRHGQVGHA